MEVIRVKDYDEMSEKACAFVTERLKQRNDLVMGFATGSTPEGLYQRLIEKYRKQEITFKDVVSFNLDEYIGLDKDHPNSYYYFMREKLFDHVDISFDNVNIPNGAASDLEAECQAFEAKIKQAGGIELQILGIGENGHIGFNEPGTPFTSRTQVVDLASSTIKANSRFFDSIEEVPTQAVSMGIGTIMESKEILLLASGETKRDAMTAVLRGDITEDVPATVLQKHPNVTIIADEAALG